MKKDIFAVYFPSWHPDAHYCKWYGKGFSEWNLLKTTKPLFDGHKQPKKPLWGYFDESKPEWMEKQIDTATDYGIDGFLFDWYWYQGERFLEKPLDETFLNARNCEKLKFALLWANHQWGKWPALEDGLSKMYGNENHGNKLFLKSTHSIEDCIRVADFCCAKYFCRDNYWKLDGKPVYCIYSLNCFTDGLGGDAEAAEALEAMQQVAKKHGFPGIHFLSNVACCEDNIYCCGWERGKRVKAIGFESIFAYNIVRSKNFLEITNEMPVYDYSEIMDSHEFCWNKLDQTGLEHFPSVTLGCDVSPRWNRNARFPFDFKDMRYEPIAINNTPERFGKLLRKATFEYKGRAVIINAWNEWSEGQYLLPEEEYQYGYLEQIRKSKMR